MNNALNELKALINSFEQQLGPLSYHFKESLECDEREELPEKLLAIARNWGFTHYLVPRCFGGKLSSLLPLFFATRILARRDLTAAIASGLTMLSSLPIWVAADEKQQRHVAKQVMAGMIGAFALTEERHGSDISANELTATACEHGWKLRGEKWCINYATLGNTATVICRTTPAGGLLGYSVFILEKNSVSSALTPLQKLRTLGVRGLDISGFRLDDVLLPESALIGKKGQGLSIIWRTLQISRVLCTGLSLGAADTALRLTMSFSLQRILYGQPAYEIPAVKQRLAECLSTLLLADCLSWTMIRACTLMPESMSVWSAIAKFLVPVLSEQIVDNCALVLGARSYLRNHDWAMFQKFRRDNQIIGLFDGSTQVNLSVIAANLVSGAAKRKEQSKISADQLRQLFYFADNPPDFTGEGLCFSNPEVDAVIAGVMSLKSEKINPLIQVIQNEIRALDEQVLNRHQQKQFDKRGLYEFRLAETWCWLFAAATALQTWHYNQDTLDEALKEPDWLKLAIAQVLSKTHGRSQLVDTNMYTAVADLLEKFHSKNKLFSLMSVELME